MCKQNTSDIQLVVECHRRTHTADQIFFEEAAKPKTMSGGNADSVEHEHASLVGTESSIIELE